MKILVLAIVLVFSQFSFVYAAKPFCEQTTNEFSLGLAAGFIGASFMGYKIGKGEMSFDDGEKDFDKIGKSIQSKLKNFCSVQGNKNKNLSHMDILKLVVTDPKFGSIPSSVDNNKQFLLNKWWGLAENGKCNLKPGEAVLSLWDNEGNEYYVVDKKRGEESTKTKINDDWWLMWYGKPNIGENHISGEYYQELDQTSSLVYSKISYTFKSSNNKNILVTTFLEFTETDESGKKTKHDVSEWGETEYVACAVGKIRGTKEFSSQLINLKSKLKKAQ